MEEKITKLINQIEDDIICYRDIIDIVDNSKCLNGSEYDYMADLMSRGLEDLKRERIENFMNDYENPLDGVYFWIEQWGSDGLKAEDNKIIAPDGRVIGEL